MSFKKQQHRFSTNQQDFDAQQPISAANIFFQSVGSFQLIKI